MLQATKAALTASAGTSASHFSETGPWCAVDMCLRVFSSFDETFGQLRCIEGEKHFLAWTSPARWSHLSKALGSKAAADCLRTESAIELEKRELCSTSAN